MKARVFNLKTKDFLGEIEIPNISDTCKIVKEKFPTVAWADLLVASGQPPDMTKDMFEFKIKFTVNGDIQPVDPIRTYTEAEAIDILRSLHPEMESIEEVQCELYRPASKKEDGTPIEAAK